MEKTGTPVIPRDGMTARCERFSARIDYLGASYIRCQHDHRTGDFAKQSSGSDGAAPQSSIEPSAVCLKADRQTNRFAALPNESGGFAAAGRAFAQAKRRDCYPRNTIRFDSAQDRDAHYRKHCCNDCGTCVLNMNKKSID